ncbi:class I SAM-dependent DNA methyltransferase [Desulfatitalea alkaliphila]|uniref:Class I SAM-dependent methyltransferase n=1 Tax=Desulfatitalea alkaliphila TaxID=2929485 RepID=A0AA41R8D3_9BACT|nr:class I SAM-dependent methyltransferase [Desulfatitalea alkaliphila]MCJ8502886.1 class I SAM-dependent methyltransferase [Desulfatitalea alkaliphila]
MEAKQETPKLWEATYEAKTAQELADAYGEWAELYDRDTIKVMGYVGPQTAVSMLDGYLNSKGCRVLDAGCGTGLVGEFLKHKGYKNIDAMDYSEDMLVEAEKKSVYKKLFQEDLNEGLEIPDNSYDATICVGTFTYAHVGPEAFEELLRVTKPGGYICFTIRDGAYEEYNYREKMLELEASSQWELQELREADYLVNEKVTAKFCTYKVLAN